MIADQLELQILKVVHDAFAKPVQGGHNLCNVAEILMPRLSDAERMRLGSTLNRLFDRGWLAKDADAYYRPTRAGEAALAAG